MNRRLSIILIAACLSAGCATSPTTQTEALASDILGARARQLVCASGEIPYCITNGTRLKKASAVKECGCAPSAELRGAMQPY